MMPIASRITDILVQVTGADEVRQDPDLALFELGLLDSLGMVELIVRFSEEFGSEISPAEIEREQWATPGKIVAYMENRART